MVHVRFEMLLVALLITPSAVTAEMRVLDGKMHYLRSGTERWPAEPSELAALFHEELSQRKPQAAAPQGEHLAVCQGLGVGAEEVYPDLLALMTPRQRDEMLLAALRAAGK